MSHTEHLQRACSEYLSYLNEEINLSPAHAAHVEGILRRSRNKIMNEQHAAISEYLETLTEVVDAYLGGRVTGEVLQHYLSEQFHLEPHVLPDQVKELAQLRGRVLGSESHTPEATPASAAPKVSVIITTYNRKEFLYQAIQSILMQDYPHKEITVIDDCSSDGTDELMNRSFAGDPRVIYMRSETNSGPGNNRRRAFAAHADGEYVLFLDDDDYLIDSNYLSKAVDFHRRHPEISFVAANVFLEYSKTRQLKVSSLQLSELIRKRDYFLNFEQKGYPKPASTLTTVFKRTALIEMDILNMNMVNDASIYLRSLLIGDAGFIDTIAGVYRIHGNNITFNLSQSFLIENLEEKMLIKNMAVQQYGYSEQEIQQWFNHNVYDTIYYYLMNSAKSPTDFKSMYAWTAAHCPNIYNQLRSEFRVKLMKRQLLRVPMLRTLLGK